MRRVWARERFRAAGGRAARRAAQGCGRRRRVLATRRAGVPVTSPRGAAPSVPAATAAAATRHAPGAAAPSRVRPAAPARARRPPARTGWWRRPSPPARAAAAPRGQRPAQFAPRARQVVTGSQHQRRDAAVAGQAQRAVHQAGIAGVDATAFQPGVPEREVLQHVAGHERLARGGQAQRRDVPCQQFGARREREVEAVLGQAAAVAQGLEWQPLESRAGLQPHARLLHGRRAIGTVEARRARRGDQSVRAFADTHVDGDGVAAHQAAGRMHQHVVADAVPFGVERLQDAQRAIVFEAGHAAAGFEREIQAQSRVPGHSSYPETSALLAEVL
jgi:hypothetical protein